MATLMGVLAILMWGLLAVLSVYTQAIPPFQLLIMCFAIAAALVFIKRLLQGEACFKKPNLTKAQWLIGTLSLFGFHFCYFMAIRYAPAIEVSLIGYLWPLLLGIYVATKGTRIWALLGGAMGFVGTAVMLTAGDELQANSAYWLGYALAFACALIWSAYSWFISTANNHVEDIAWLCLLVALLSLIPHWYWETANWDLPLSAWLSAIALGLGPVGGAFYLSDVAMKNGRQQWLASLSFATPVISSVCLFAFGMSELSPVLLLVIGLILLGAVVSNSGHKVTMFLQKRRKEGQAGLAK